MCTVRFCLASFVAMVFSLHAGTFHVTSLADSGPGSLRQAIFDANSSGGGNIVVTSITGRIALADPLPTVLANVHITGPAANALTISGNDQVRVFSFANGTTSILAAVTIANGLATNYANGAGISNAGSLFLFQCSVVSNRNLGGWGGGIYNSGDLAIVGCTISANQVIGEDGSGGGGGGAGLGGGVFSESGVVSITNSTLSGNVAQGGFGEIGYGGSGGGALGGQAGTNCNATGSLCRGGDGQAGGFGGGGGPGGWGHPAMPGNGGTGGFGGGGGGALHDGLPGEGGVGGGSGLYHGAAVMDASTAAGGGAGFGGAVFVKDGSLMAVNATITANHAIGGRGALAPWLWSAYPFGYLCAGAGAGRGGGVYNLASTAVLQNNLIAGNTVTNILQSITNSIVRGSATNLSADAFGVIHSFGGNIIADAEGSTGWTDLDLLNVSAQIGPLQDNGGPTWTHALLPRSPALEIGVDAGAPTVDQRGLPRPQGLHVDIGAVEFAYNAPTLVTWASTGGTITRTPDAFEYPSNSTVTLTGVPNPDYRFLNWSESASGSANPLTLVMDQVRFIRAWFALTRVTTPISGLGSITRIPDKSSYDLGDEVVLTATPARWYRFARWGDGVTNNPRTITIGNSNTYPAEFEAVTDLETLTFGSVSRLAPVGMPAILVDGQFIVASFVARDTSAQIELRTTFTNGLMFYTLDGEAPSFESTHYSGPFTTTRNVKIRAIAYSADFMRVWEADPVRVSVNATYKLTASATGGGTLTVEPLQDEYESGTVVNLVAMPNPGWTFLGWQGAVEDDPGNSVGTVTMTRDQCVRAVFGTSLNTTVVGAGNVVLRPPGGVYPYGTTVQLYALPQPGSYFGLWGNAGSGSANPLSFTVTSAGASVSSLFGSLSSTQVSLAVIPDGLGRVTVTPSTNRYVKGTNVTVTAFPDADQVFLGWSGDASGTENPLMVSLPQSKQITARFTRRPRFLFGACEAGSSDVGSLLTLAGDWSTPYLLERSTNLTTWLPIATLTNSLGTMPYFDREATNAPANFYRARLLAE